jgi:hypothetical protein
MALFNPSSPIQRTKRLVLAASSVLVALTLTAGVSACQDHRGDNGSARTGAVPAVQTVAIPDPQLAVQVQATAVPPATSDAPARGRSADAPVTVYLVGSEEQASTVRWGLVEGDAIRAQFGEPPLTWVVLVIGSPDEEERLLATLRDTDAVRHQSGLPGLVVVDLRA